ncbi:beta-1,6-galactanase [bacterium]|nr:MAG: beta-1,6-galactanase [bacterium]
MSPLAALIAIAQTPTIAPDPNTSHGVWEGWGTSLCWMGNVFGDRDDIADTFFTLKDVPLMDTRLPGLGLNIVRYNAGACSWNEFDGRKMAVSKIILPYRQMPGFWLDGKDPDPRSKSWDWTVDAKQRAMMTKAKARGADRFELFSNAPMWWMCANDNPSGAAKPTDDNLRLDHHRAFAIYMAAVAKQAKDRWGVTFTTVEPFNEPVSEWWFADCKQEGCHFSPAAQASVLKLLREEMDKRGLDKMRIAASDETYFDHALETWKSFDAETKALVDQVNVHSYQGDKGARRGLREATLGKPLWNSEHGEGDASGLSLMRAVNQDFHELRPTAWSYWQPLDGGGWGLIESDMPNAKLLKTNPKYFVLAQYTRHIRPGASILETGDADTVAALDPNRRKLTVVAINGERQTRKTLDLSKGGWRSGTIRSWRTEPKGTARYERQSDVRFRSKTIDIDLPPNSVTTFEIGR